MAAEQTEALARIHAATQAQLARYGAEKPLYNANLSSIQVTEYCHLTPPAKKLLNQYADQRALSARSYFKAIKIAQTIADLESAPNINLNHIAEALQYRLDNSTIS